VSVGNILPGATVLIKITYVAELPVEDENIVFSLPGSLAPWSCDQALKVILGKNFQKCLEQDGFTLLLLCEQRTNVELNL
jgi:hypothetical protein